MKNDEIRNSGFEETLKNKMDELASSVDCFDKISKRAFPESSTEYSDSEFTICDLDNVTGKKKNFRFMSIAAIAAAFVLCLFFLPKNESFMNFVYSNIGIGSDKKAFRGLISEIKEETADGSYVYYDCTLEEYIENDILISPLYRCPFEKSEKDNLNVRIFVKTHNGVPTNQVYAVEYEGNYDNGNFIAAADSNAKFTDDELLTISQDLPELATVSSFDMPLSSSTFIPSSSSFLNKDGDLLSVAGFSYNCYYKTENEILPLQNEILYCTNGISEDSGYIFDICSVRINGDETTSVYSENVIAQLHSGWDNIVYYNGSSAESDGAHSRFVQADLDGSLNTAEETIMEESICYITPFANKSESTLNADLSDISIYVTDRTTSDMYASVQPPLNPALRSSFKIYLPYSSSLLKVSSTNSLISSYDLNFGDYEFAADYFQQQEQQQQMLEQEQQMLKQAALNDKEAIEAEIAHKKAVIEALNTSIMHNNEAIAIQTDENEIKELEEFNELLYNKIETLQTNIKELEEQLITFTE